ncbi:Chymase [Manis javanica]|nr:Chymase [Manis javanica]
MQPLLLLLLLAFLQSHGAKAGKIIGGQEAKPHSRPYMAYLCIWNPKKGPKECGGFLIQEKFVLTAAHCWGSSISITLGAHNIKKQERTQQVIAVRRAIPHPDYNHKSFSDDIMLLQLKEKANLTLAVGTLPLAPQFDFIQPGRVCRAAGWGRTEVNGKTNSVFKGDSGGPLLCAGVAQGIVSYTRRDAKPPDVFTRISHYRPWINKVLKEN